MKIVSLLTSIFLLLAVASCAMPSKRTNYIPYNSDVTLTPVSPSEVKLMAETFPEGITLKNNLVEVENSFKDQYVIVGRVEVQLKSGESPNSLPHNLKLFWDPDTTNGLQKYCTYNVVGFFPLPILNYLNPTAWPCFALDNYYDEEEESIKYREELLRKEMAKKAAAIGANLVVGLKTGGISIVSGQTGQVLANSQAWSATGYAVFKVKAKKATQITQSN